MEQRFSALRTISMLFKVLAWIAGIVGVVTAIAVLFAPVTAPGTVLLATRLGGFILVLLSTALYVLFLYGAGELINLFLSIEHNTYMASQEMQKTRVERAA